MCNHADVINRLQDRVLLLETVVSVLLGDLQNLPNDNDVDDRVVTSRQLIRIAADAEEMWHK